MQRKTIYGPSIQTDNMHNAEVVGPYDSNVYGEYANSWFKRYTLTISVEPGWHFEGDPSVHLVSTDREAIEGFTWNNFPGAHDRFFVTQRSLNFIECTCWAGSHPMIINLACDAVKE